jgi:hypothetical protein
MTGCYTPSRAEAFALVGRRAHSRAVDYPLGHGLSAFPCPMGRSSWVRGPTKAGYWSYAERPDRRLCSQSNHRGREPRLSCQVLGVRCGARSGTYLTLAPYPPGVLPQSSDDLLLTESALAHSSSLRPLRGLSYRRTVIIPGPVLGEQVTRTS